jgi:hypothetical protein
MASKGIIKHVFFSFLIPALLFLTNSSSPDHLLLVFCPPTLFFVAKAGTERPG